MCKAATGSRHVKSLAPHAQVNYNTEGTLGISEFLRGHNVEREGLPGIFAIYNDRHALQYIGHAKNVSKEVEKLQRRVPNRSATYVKVKLYRGTTHGTIENLEKEAKDWLDAADACPPGNGKDAAVWADSSTAELTTSSAGQVASPFSTAVVHREVGEGLPQPAVISVESVETVLDTVRGYLLSDGGDVSVHSADPQTGIVELRFQGACATCSAQDTTMSMGIERALHAAFGSQLKGVVAVDSADDEQRPTRTTKEAVSSLLQLLRPAVVNYGGRVEVESVQDGLCLLSYEGPEPIWIGVRSAIRDKFADLEEVRRA